MNRREQTEVLAVILGIGFTSTIAAVATMLQAQGTFVGLFGILPLLGALVGAYVLPAIQQREVADDAA